MSSGGALGEERCGTVVCAGDPGAYLTAFTGDAAVVVPCGFVPTHDTQLIFV